MKKIIVSLLLIFSIIIQSTKVYADVNLEQMDKQELNRVVGQLINSVVTGDTKYIDTNSYYFKTSELNRFKSIILNNSILTDGYISTLLVDNVEVNNSSTGDFVILANAKLQERGKSYNIAYLFEFHINSEGKIYGFNIWAY